MALRMRIRMLLHEYGASASASSGSSGWRLTEMTREPENVMSDINTALAASKEAIEQLIASGERCGPAWVAPRAPGKWSPSQIVEHVARSLEESANMAEGRASKFPKLRRIRHGAASASRETDGLHGEAAQSYVLPFLVSP